MSTTTLETPTIISPESDENFQVGPETPQSEEIAKISRTYRGLDSYNVHAVHGMSVGEVLDIRDSVQTSNYKDVLAKDKEISSRKAKSLLRETLEEVVDEYLPELDDQDEKYRVRLNERGELLDMLTKSDKWFDKRANDKAKAQQNVNSYRAERGERGSVQVLPASEQDSEHENTTEEEVSATAKKMNDLGIDPRHAALIGGLHYKDLKSEVNSLDITEQERKDIYERRASDKIASAIVSSRHTEEDMSEIDAENIKMEEDNLSDVIYDYRSMDSNAKTDVRAEMDKAKDKSEMSKSSRLRRMLGGTAVTGASITGALRSRFSKKNKDHNSETGTGGIANIYNKAYAKTGAALTEWNSKQLAKSEEKHGPLSDKEYEKRERKKALIVAGLATAALVTIKVVNTMHGLDGGGTSAKYDGFPPNIHAEIPSAVDGFLPDDIESDRSSGTGSPASGYYDRTNPGNTNMTRSEIFDNRIGARSLTDEGRSALFKSLDGHVVQPGDTVWDLSEEKLKQSGISNPTVFEIDATKDVILRELKGNGLVKENGFLTTGTRLRL